MAENLTTDSTSTPATAPAAEVQTPSPSSTSTTEPQSPSEPERQAEGTTLLTGGDNSAVSPEPSNPAGETQQSAEDEARAAFFGAPEGDYELTGLPEGTVIDTDALAAVAPIAKELGLSNEGLSRLAQPFAEKIVPHLTEQVTQQILDQSAQTTRQWANDAIEAVRTDEVYGGKSLADVQAVSAKAIDRFGGAEFRAYLEDTGLGNHPAMLRAMYLAGSAISEDTTFERGGNAPRPKSREEKFYGS